MPNSPTDTMPDPSAPATVAETNRPPAKIRKIRALLPMPRPGYPLNWIRSLQLTELKRIIRTRIHRYVRRRFLYVKIHRRTLRTSWLVFFRHKKLRTITAWDVYPGSILITTAVCIGNKHFRIASGGVQLHDNAIQFTVTSTDSLRSLGTTRYIESAFIVPFESCRKIWVAETEGAYVVMFMLSKKVFHIVEAAAQRALGAASDSFMGHLTSDGYYSLVFEMPDNYNVDRRNLYNFTAFFIFMRKLMFRGSVFAYRQTSVENVNDELKHAGIQLMKTYNILNNPVYIFRPMPRYPLPPVLNEHRPTPKEFVSITLKDREIKFYEGHLVDLMGYSILKGQVVDFYIDHMLSQLSPSVRNRISVVSVFELQHLEEPRSKHDDFFKKDFVVIPIFRPIYWSFVILTNPGVLINLPESRGKIATAVIVSTSLAKVPKKHVAELVALFVQLRFVQLKVEGLYRNAQCNPKKMVPCCMGLTTAKGFNDSGVYILQLLNNILNHLPEPAAEMRLTFDAVNANYMSNYAFRYSIRAAISSRVKAQERRIPVQPYQFPVASDSQDDGEQRRERALAFWDFFLKKMENEAGDA
uniref:Rho-GAP domain-containing protein n=1 Tax=Panagrellus redivivus TaxID=6233 RepID=A0A7E4W1R0_PANRE